MLKKLIEKIQQENKFFEIDIFFLRNRLEFVETFSQENSSKISQEISGCTYDGGTAFHEIELKVKFFFLFFST